MENEIKQNCVEKSKLFSCPVCQKVLNTKQNLQRHLKSIHCLDDKHTKVVEINCEHCPKTFPSFEARMKHLQDAKKKETLYNCVECDKQYTKEKNLKAHVKSTHEGQVFSCDDCEKTYTRKVKLMDHKKKHHTKVKCRLCNLTFAKEATLKKHMKSKHEGNHLLNFVQKSRKPIAECTNRHQKRKAKNISNALKNVTGTYKNFRRNVFYNVVNDNRDLHEMLSKFLQFKPISHEDIVRITTKSNISDRQAHLIMEELKDSYGKEAVVSNSKKASINRKNIYKPFFKKEKIQMKVEGGKLEERWLVFI